MVPILKKVCKEARMRQPVVHPPVAAWLGKSKSIDPGASKFYFGFDSIYALSMDLKLNKLT